MIIAAVIGASAIGEYIPGPGKSEIRKERRCGEAVALMLGRDHIFRPTAPAIDLTSASGSMGLVTCI